MLRNRIVLCGGLAVLVSSAMTLQAASSTLAAVAAPRTSTSVQCVSATSAYASLAKQMASAINNKIQGRGTPVGLNLTDNKTGVTCWYHSTRHFYAASVIKVTILGALLRKAIEQHRYLTNNEVTLSKLMIEQSDNNAATALWDELGIPFIQHFLNLVGMTQTQLNAAWGLSQITAHDELLLLGALSNPNKVLNSASQAYGLSLMANVISSQRWGVPAGAPTSVTVHVKNGWLPYPGSQWEINSIGTFTAPHRTYMITMLTYDNPSMAYGIDTIEGAAEVIHHLLNPGTQARVARSTPNSSWGIPDETIPKR